MLNRTKDVLHKRSGYLNKFKATQRTEENLADGDPCQ